MEYYIETMRAAAEKCDPCELKPMLDFYLELAQEDYKGGALDVVEYGDIVNEYTGIVKSTNAINYI